MVSRIKIPTFQMEGALAREKLLEEFHNLIWYGLTLLSSTSQVQTGREIRVVTVQI